MTIKKPAVKERHLLHVAADTTLGVLFTTLESKNPGGVLIEERIKTLVAEKHGLPVEEVHEIVSVRIETVTE